MTARRWPDETKAAALQRIARGVRSKFVATELGVPRRTISEWIEGWLADGTLAEARARLREAAGDAPPPEASPEASEPATGPGGAGARPRRRSRLDILLDALERQQELAADENLDARDRTAADRAVASIAESLARLTAGQDLEARLGRLDMTPAEALAACDFIERERAWAAEPDVALAASVARLGASADEAADAVAVLCEALDGWAGILGALGESGPPGLRVWPRIVSRVGVARLARELREPDCAALLDELVRVVDEVRAERLAAARARDAEERLRLEDAARRERAWLRKTLDDVSRGEP